LGLRKWLVSPADVSFRVGGRVSAALRSRNFNGTVGLAQLPPGVALIASNQVFNGVVQLTNAANVLASSDIA
jgi:hypothetical protein